MAKNEMPLNLQYFLESEGLPIFHQKYNFQKIAKKVMKLAQKGAVLHNRVIAGNLSVTQKTLCVWKREKEEFAMLLDIATNIAAAQAEERYRQGGEDGIDNASAQKIFELSLKVQKKAVRFGRDLKESMQILLDQYAQADITASELQSLTNVITQAETADLLAELKEAHEQLKKGS